LEFFLEYQTISCVLIPSVETLEMNSQQLRLPLVLNSRKFSWICLDHRVVYGKVTHYPYFYSFLWLVDFQLF
jgi:hypothetical protein